MISNNKTSNILSSQAPGFVRDDHPVFLAFLDAYYEFMEQDGGVSSSSQQITDYNDVDKTISYFQDYLYNSFLEIITPAVLVDREILIKNVRSFYNSRGTPKALSFFLRILLDTDSEIYYPKINILKVSDGKWYIQRSLRINSIKVNGIPKTDINSLELFSSGLVTGVSSNSSAIISSTNRFSENNIQLNELIIDSFNGTFLDGEGLISYSNNNILTANVASGGILAVNLINPGLSYDVGDSIDIISATGTKGSVTVSSVSSGNLTSIIVLKGGAGFLANDFINSTSDTGSGLMANVKDVDISNTYHPNSYIIFNSTISLEANTPIGNTVYSNLNHGIVSSPNANTSFANALNSFIYGPTGPVVDIIIHSGGEGYKSIPTMNIFSNNIIKSLGILGRMNVVNSGIGYSTNDSIKFINYPGSSGFGANAIISHVSANGAIMNVSFTTQGNTGYPIGGLSYDFYNLPSITIISANGSGANISVTAILGTGELLTANTSNVGQITGLTIDNKGTGYKSGATFLDFTNEGNGQATGNVIVSDGISVAPGRYLNDDGRISGYSFLENRDYYQNYSYVVKIKNSLSNYASDLLKVLGPAGTILFGEYVDEYEDSNDTMNVNVLSFDVQLIPL